MQCRLDFLVQQCECWWLADAWRIGAAAVPLALPRQHQTVRTLQPMSQMPQRETLCSSIVDDLHMGNITRLAKVACQQP